MNTKFLGTSFKIGTALSLLFVTACSEMHKRNLQQIQATGPEFSQRLAKEYQSLGETEQTIMYDEVSASRYFLKATRAKTGCPVMPNVLSEWRLEKEKLPELITARARLMRALEKGAGEVAPKSAAHTQAYFDCWVEQEAEEWQKEDIAACRSEFYEGMADVELMLMGGVTHVQPNRMVFFDFGNAHLDPEALKATDDIASLIKASKSQAHVLLIGRTDRIGDAKHNKNLSQHRAMMVKKELVRRGIAPHQISVQAAGETPGPNVDAHNRRVDIILLESN